MTDQIPAPPPTRPPLFAIGAAVRRRGNTARTGTVQEAQWNPSLNAWMLKVRFTHANALSALPEFELDRLPPEGPNALEDLRLGLVTSPQALKTLLTLERLKAPPAPLGERTAPVRAAFDPQAWLPLLKLLELPTPRLLLADAWGASPSLALGLLVRDFLVRRQARQVLIFTPRQQRLAVAHGLRRELGLPVSILDTRAFRTHLLAMKKGWELPAITAVVSLESLDAPDLAGMLQQYHPAIDLVVLDEAHRLTPGTTSYGAADALARASDGLILRTQQAIRQRPEDLLPLLSLLEPSELEGLDPLALVSTTQVASRLLQRVHAGAYAEALEPLEMLLAHPAFSGLAHEEAVQCARQRLELLAEGSTPPEPSERLALGRLLEGLHPVLARMTARTGSSAPAIVPLVMEVPAQEPIQKLVASLRSALHAFGEAALAGGHFPALILPYKLAQQCLHSAAAFLQEHAHKGGLWLNAPLENEEDLERDPVDLPAFTLEDTQHARWAGSFQALLAEPFEVYQDVKLDCLLHALTTLWQEDESQGKPARKLVLYSPHLRVLRQLAQQLQGAGFQTRLLAGSLALDELQLRTYDFVSDPEIRILLTTDRAGSCMPLDVAQGIIHYDLPWDPQLLAQRLRSVLPEPGAIGGSSRILQLFVVESEGFEAQVLLPLYQGLGLLEAPEHALEGALSADDVLKLLARYLSPDASTASLAEAVEAQVTQGNARAQSCRDARHAASGLLAADAHLREALEALRSPGAWPSPEEQRLLLVQTLASRFPGIRLSGEPILGEGQLDLTPAAVKALQARGIGHGPLVQALAVKAAKGAFPVTWRGARAAVHAECEGIMPGHPLMEWVRSLVEPELKGHGRAFCLLVKDEQRAPGRYVLGIWQVVLDGPREGRRVFPLAVRLDASAEGILDLEQSRQLYQALLARGEDVPSPEEVDLPRLEQALAQLEAGRQALLGRLEAGAGVLEHHRLERRRTRAVAAAGARVAQVSAEVKALQEVSAKQSSVVQEAPAEASTAGGGAVIDSGVDDAVIFMAKSRLKARVQIREALERIPAHGMPVGLSSTLLAVGLVDVVRG